MGYARDPLHCRLATERLHALRKEIPAIFVAAFDLTFVYVRLAAAPVGEIFLQRLLYWLRSSG